MRPADHIPRPILKPPQLRDGTAVIPPDVLLSAAGHDPIWQADAALAAPFDVPMHPVLLRLLDRVPLNIRQSFTPDQMMALSRATLPIRESHPVDYRISVPLFSRRYYLTVLAGRERRSRERLLKEGQSFAARISLFYSATAIVVTAVLLLAAAVALYAAKSLVGIDLMQDHFVLHDALKSLAP